MNSVQTLSYSSVDHKVKRIVLLISHYAVMYMNDIKYHAFNVGTSPRCVDIRCQLKCFRATNQLEPASNTSQIAGRDTSIIK